MLKITSLILIYTLNVKFCIFYRLRLGDSDSVWNNYGSVRYIAFM